MENQNENAEQVKILAPIVKPTESKEFLLSKIGQELKSFELQQRRAMIFTSSDIVPERYRGNQNIGNVMIAMEMAERLKTSPLVIMQNLYIVKGNPGFSSTYLIASVNASGRFTPLRYRLRGKENTDERACQCYAYEISDKEHKEELSGTWITMAMAKKEGWSTKPGSKWQTMPEQMLKYRAAAWWQRVYCPEISMGLKTTEEYEDITQYEEIPNKSKTNLNFDATPQEEAKPMSEDAQTESTEEPSKGTEHTEKPEENKHEEPKKPQNAQELFGE